MSLDESNCGRPCYLFNAYVKNGFGRLWWYRIYWICFEGLRASNRFINELLFILLYAFGTLFNEKKNSYSNAAYVSACSEKTKNKLQSILRLSETGQIFSTFDQPGISVLFFHLWKKRFTELLEFLLCRYLFVEHIDDYFFRRADVHEVFLADILIISAVTHFCPLNHT